MPRAAHEPGVGVIRGGAGIGLFVALALASLGLGFRRPLHPQVEVAPGPEAVAAWEELLGRAVGPGGELDYDRVQSEREALDLYMGWLATPESRPSGSRARYAYYLNAYNALCIFAVLEQGRPSSVRDVRGWLPVPGMGFHVQQEARIGGEWLSPAQIKDSRLRGRYQDERVHAAINCATASGPPLRAELYTVEGLDRQLDEQMRRWLSDPARGLRTEGGQVVASPIFDWYRRDFDRWTGGRSPCALGIRSVRGSLKQALRGAEREGCPLRYTDYDWALNHRAARAE